MLRLLPLPIALVALAASASAAAVLLAPDPAHDVMVTRESVSVPVDSIDILSYALRENGAGTKGVTLQVADVSRVGLEDRLFVQSAHSLRVYGYAELYDDGRGLNLVALSLDGSPDIRSFAFIASRQGIVELPHVAKLDVASDTMHWKLEEPVTGPRPVRFSFAAIAGCDDFDTCQPPSPAASPFDMAPNDLAQALLIAEPQVWWSALLPEDDGSVPRAPVSLAALTDDAR